MFLAYSSAYQVDKMLGLAIIVAMAWGMGTPLPDCPDGQRLVSFPLVPELNTGWQTVCMTPGQEYELAKRFLGPAEKTHK